MAQVATEDIELLVPRIFKKERKERTTCAVRGEEICEQCASREEGSWGLESSQR
jgi:hypothetical protein